MTYQLGKVGDELYPGIRIGDPVSHGRGKLYGFVSNIIPDQERNLHRDSVVVTSDDPSGWDPSAPAHGTWTPVDSLTFPIPTDEEIADLFGITP